jgi:hypothetical protein
MFTKSRRTSRYANRLDCAKRRRGFDPDLLPSVQDYFATLFGSVRFNSNGWSQVRCCFHSPDKHPSLSISRDGGFKCHACGAIGGGIIDFEMLRSGTDFKTATRDLGAWR